jgi:hypothetical protein
MPMSATEEQVWLDNFEKKKKDLKKDIQITDKIEKIKDQYQYLSSKQEAELDQVRKLRNHYRKEEESVRQKHFSCQQSLENQFNTAKMKFEAAMERDCKDLENKLDYYRSRFQECDDKIDAIVKNIEYKTKQAGKKQDRLVNQVITPTGKKMVNEILYSTENEEVNLSPPSPPPPSSPSTQQDRGVKRIIQPKKAGVRTSKILLTSKESKEYTKEDRDKEEENAKKELFDIKELKYAMIKTAAEEGEKQMIQKNSQLKVLQNKLNHLTKVVPYPDDDIFTVENEINVLAREIELIREQIPKTYRK